MKKLVCLILIIVLVIIYLYINNNNKDTSIYKDVLLNNVEKKIEGSVTNYYIYGNHFNIEGLINIDNYDNYSLILKSDKKEIQLECNFEVKDDKLYFYTSKKINDGINLDKLELGNYYLFLKYNNEEKVKYYTLKNDTKFDNLEYYTITKNNSNNKINIDFKSKDSIDYIKFNISKSNLPSDVYDIVIDPGHGGIDTGTSYKYNGNTYFESKIVFDIALKLKEKLEKEGYKVLLTRTNDKDLEYYNENGRAVLPNKYHTKLCLSLHLNSDKYNMKYGGVEVYIPNDIDIAFAKILSSKLGGIIGYSKKIDNKIDDGIYFDAFTRESIKKINDEYIEQGLNAYDILVNAPSMYMIREVGGISTHAYVDGRNEKYGLNPYYNSNQTTEGYLIELGYISYEDDLISLTKNTNKYSDAILKSIKEYYK